jgi:DegV family protein with EDD domain
MEQYEGSTIICIDSLNASMGVGMLAIEAAKMASNGASAAEIEAHILAIRKKVNQYVTVHSLDALRRAGRVKGPAAFFGNLMGVKPIIISDENGTQAAYRKVKGRQRSLEEIVSLLKASIVEPEKQVIYLTHADCPQEEIDTLVDLIKKEIPCIDVEIGFIGPIVGASIGPDAVGIWGLGQEVTYRIGD